MKAAYGGIVSYLMDWRKETLFELIHRYQILRRYFDTGPGPQLARFSQHYT